MNIGAGPMGPDGVPDLMVEVAREPHFAHQRLETSPFFVRGADAYSFRRAPDDFRGCYLSVVASKQFPVTQELLERYQRYPDAAGILGEVASAVGDLRSEVRQKALHAATICAVELAPAVLEPWLEFDVFWSSSTTQRSVYSTIVSEVLDASSADSDSVRALCESVVFGAASSDFTKSIQLAGGWYLKGRAEPAGSTERFVGLFQCIEALCNCAPQEPDPQLDEWFVTIARMLASSAADERVLLEPILAKIRERVARPVLSERFRRLLEMLAIEGRDERIVEFNLLNRIRNDLLHAHVSFVPASYRGFDVDATLTALARVTLTALVRRVIADSRGRYRVEFSDRANTG